MELQTCYQIKNVLLCQFNAFKLFCKEPIHILWKGFFVFDIATVTVVAYTDSIAAITISINAITVAIAAATTVTSFFLFQESCVSLEFGTINFLNIAAQHVFWPASRPHAYVY